MQTPLDVAGQVALILWTLDDLPSDAAAIAPVLQELLDSCGIGGIEPLKARKLRGLSVFGQIQPQPQNDLAPDEISKALERLMGTLVPVASFGGYPVASGPDYSQPEGSLLTDEELTLENLRNDLAVQRSARSQLDLQMQVTRNGLELTYNPLQRRSVERYCRVGAGDTLQAISVRTYGTASKWGAIASENGLSFPYTLVPGQLLRIPE